MNQVHIYYRNVYGLLKMYPANDTGRKFAALLGVKTFTADQLAQIKGLGFQVWHQDDPAIAAGVVSAVQV